MEMLKQENRERLLQMKHDLDMQKYNAQHSVQPADVVDAQAGSGNAPAGTMSYDTNDMLKLLDEIDEEDDGSEDDESESNEHDDT